MGALATRGRSLALVSAAVLALVLGLRGEAAHSAAAGQVAAYSFDAGSGATLADASGNGRDGTISGATWSSAGHSGGALSFDGVDDWVTVADNAALDLVNGMTLEAWVKPSANGSWRTVVTKEQSGNLVYGLFPNSDTGTPASIVSIGSNPVQDIARGPSGLALSNWTHVATTYDGAALRLYVNGAQAGSKPVSGAMPNSSQPLRIGGNSVWTEWFQGLIDDLRIYNRALSASEIQTDMNTPVSQPPSTPTDTAPPSAPTNLVASGVTQTSVTLAWNASTDNVGVTGYGRYRNGTLVASGTGTNYTFTGLACGTAYALAVDAYDAAGNRSAKTSVTAATAACTDTTPPSTPSGLAVTSTNASSIALAWNASTDNLGVTGYGRYRNGTLVTSGTGTSYTFTGLTCGTSHTLAIDAYDAAGNRSAKASITASTSPCITPTVAAYAFDSGSGTTLVDASGNGRNGTISGATWSTAGHSGYALSFDGVNDWVTVADNAGLDLVNGMTLEAWVKPSANGSWRTVVTKEQSGNLVYGLFSASDTSNPASIVSIGANPVQDISRGPNGLSLSTWTHLATTYDGATLRLYVNGAQVGSKPVSGAMPNSSQPLRIGGNSVWTEWFQGLIDDLRIYNRALSASEIQTDMNTAVGPPPPPPPPPPADTAPPSAPTGLVASGLTQTSVTLSWNASTDNVGVTGYGRYRNGTLTSSGTGTSYTFTGLTCATSYTLAVDAYDAAGNRSGKAQIIASTSACSAPPPSSGSSNLWMDTNGGSCTRQASPAAYTDAQACGTLTAAYNAASAGDTITVSAGTYGRQVVPSGTKTVTIRNTPGTTPVFGTTTVDASNITMVGIKIQRNDDPGGTIATLEAKGNNNTFDGVNVDTKKMPVRQGIYANGDNNTFKNGSTYNVVDEKGALVGGTRVTFDNFNFYDVWVTNSAVHNECVYSNGPNLTVRKSRFWNCATMDLFITRGDWWGQPLYGGITLENNVFGHSTNTGAGSWHYYGLGINGGVIQEMRNWRVVNNTFETAVGGNAPAPGTVWANNVGSWDCFSQATFVNNVGNKCSASDRAVSPAASCGLPACSSPYTAAQGWANPAANDFHLKAGAPAINAASATYAPVTDKDGYGRVGAPDAGAYEYRG